GKSIIGRLIKNGKGWDEILFPVVEFLLVRDRPVIIEVGTNIGSSLIQMARARPQAIFYCFEPSNRFLPYLKKNVEKNQLRNVNIIPLLVSPEEGSSLLFNNKTTASVVIDKYDGHELDSMQKVNNVSLDRYFKNIKKIDLIKIDTDGYDFDVMLSGEKVIREFKPYLYFEYETSLLKEAGHTPKELFEFLDELGYTTFLIFSNVGVPLKVTSSFSSIGKLAKSYPYLDILASTSNQSQNLRKLLSHLNLKVENDNY